MRVPGSESGGGIGDPESKVNGGISTCTSISPFSGKLIGGGAGITAFPAGREGGGIGPVIAVRSSLFGLEAERTGGGALTGSSQWQPTELTPGGLTWPPVKLSSPPCGSTSPCWENC